MAFIDSRMVNGPDGKIVFDSLNDHASSLAEKAKKGDLVINVKDFGAKGDGTTDDTAAIQATFNSLNYADNPTSVAQMGTVYFPTGIYKISASINIKGGVTVKGAGRDSSIILNSSTTQDTLTVLQGTYNNAGTDITIMDLKLKCSVVPTAGAGINIGFNFPSGYTVQNVNIIRCHVFGHFNGIELGNIVMGCMDQCYINHSIQDGVITSGTMNGFSIRNTYSQVNGRHGYNFLGNYCSFFNTGSDGNGGDGYHFFKRVSDGGVVSTLALTSIGAEYNTGAGINFEGGQDIALNGCFLNPTTDHCIILTDVVGFTAIAYNGVTSTAGKYGIYQSGSCKRITLLNGYMNAPSGLTNDMSTVSSLNFGTGSQKPSLSLATNTNGDVPLNLGISSTPANNHLATLVRAGAATYYLDILSNGMFGITLGANTPFQIMNDAQDKTIRLYGGGAYFGNGIQLRSPNGTFYKITVNDSGQLVVGAGTPT